MPLKVYAKIMNERIKLPLGATTAAAFKGAGTTRDIFAVSC
jgi:hypothetical protein